MTPSHSDSEELPDSDMPSGSLGPAQPEHIRSCNGAGKVSSVDNNKFANKIFFLKISFLASHVFGQITQLYSKDNCKNRPIWLTF